MISRRNFIKALIAGSALLSCSNVFASKNGIEKASSIMFDKQGEGRDQIKSNEFSDEKTLYMCNIHTGESLNIQYYSAGVYDPDAIDKINYFLRCYYSNEVKEMDIGLLDLMCDIKERIGKEKEIQIISGYRSSIYNQLLISQGRNVSRNSLHLQGLAIDFAIEGISNDKLSSIAKSFEAGGVGQYPEFVHIDVGRVRYW